MTDCPVCQTDMGCEFYKSTHAEDEEVNDSIFRLKCGHAFHNGCLCRALRLDNSCPICRESAVQSEFTMNITVDENGQLHLSADDAVDVQAPETLDETSIAILSKINSVRKLGRVQKARSKVNKLKRIYRKFEQELFQVRCGYLDEAFKTLREFHRSEYERIRRNLERGLKKLRNVEWTEMTKTNNTQDWQNKLNEFFGESFSLRHHVDNFDTFGPLKHKFWSR